MTTKLPLTLYFTYRVKSMRLKKKKKTQSVGTEDKIMGEESGYPSTITWKSKLFSKTSLM